MEGEEPRRQGETRRQLCAQQEAAQPGDCPQLLPMEGGWNVACGVPPGGSAGAAGATHPGSPGWRPHSPVAPAPRRTAQSSSAEREGIGGLSPQALKKPDTLRCFHHHASSLRGQPISSNQPGTTPPALPPGPHRFPPPPHTHPPTWGPYRKKPIMKTVAHCMAPMEAGTAAKAISMAAMPSV